MTDTGFSAEERAAMKERAQEVRPPRKGAKAKVDDDGTLWPTAFALTELSAEDETRLAELIKRA